MVLLGNELLVPYSSLIPASFHPSKPSAGGCLHEASQLGSAVGQRSSSTPLVPWFCSLGTGLGCLCCSHQLLAASPALIPVWALEGMGEALRCFRNVPARAARVGEPSLTTPARSRSSRTPLPFWEAPVPPAPIPRALPAVEFRP